MVRVITIMDDVYADLNRLKREKGMSFTKILRFLLNEREQKKDILSFAGSVNATEVDSRAIDNARKMARGWRHM